MCCTLIASAQFNLQLHYDLGRHMNSNSEANRQLFTVTAEFFRPDKLGSTYLFIDMDYRGDGPTNNGAIGTYWEMSRDFTFAKIKNTNSSFTAHMEYNGGLKNQFSFQQCMLLGPAWQWHSDDFNKTFTFHATTCPYVDDIYNMNKEFFTGTRDEAIISGYSPCSRCSP